MPALFKVEISPTWQLGYKLHRCAGIVVVSSEIWNYFYQWSNKRKIRKRTPTFIIRKRTPTFISRNIYRRPFSWLPKPIKKQWPLSKRPLGFLSLRQYLVLSLHTLIRYFGFQSSCAAISRRVGFRFLGTVSSFGCVTVCLQCSHP